MADDVATNALGNLFSAGMSFATGNPIGAAAGIAGLGLSLFGGLEKAKASKEIAAAQQQIAGLEGQQDDVRRASMRLSARRQQIEVLRNQQRARSLALNAATSQGASMGSGLQGGYGQIAGATQWNLEGIQSSLASGEQMFDLNRLIGAQKQRIASAGGDAATASGISSIGGALSSNVSNFGKIRFGSTGASSVSEIPSLDTLGQNASRMGSGLW